MAVRRFHPYKERMTPLLIIFVAATVAWTVLELVLSLRQTRHVSAHRDRVPADFAGTVTLDEHRQAADYTAARERLSRFETLAEALLPLFWALGGIDLLYGALARAVPPSLSRGVLFFLVTGLVGTLVGLPFALIRAFGIEARFGFNKVTPALFVADRLKGAVISLLFTVPLLYALLFAMDHLAGLWWLWTWAGLLVIMVAAPSVFVRLIAPRFNRFEPLADADLRGRIETLLARSGFTASGLFTMDASRRSTHGNAYFIGFGRAKRIVLFDTLIARSTPEEIEAVVAHELGHFKHRHVIFGLARAALMLLVTLAAFGWLARQPWLLPAFGVHAHSDALSLYVCLLLSGVVSPLGGLFGNWISRKNEFEADDYARRAVGADPMVSALTRLSRDNASTLTPDPWYSLVHHSHPPVPARVSHLRSAAAT